jgi:hypothetical protein
MKPDSVERGQQTASNDHAKNVDYTKDVSHLAASPSNSSNAAPESSYTWNGTPTMHSAQPSATQKPLEAPRHTDRSKGPFDKRGSFERPCHVNRSEVPHGGLASPHAQHAHIEITRANGVKQDLAAYPVGGLPGTGEGGQLTFEAGNEKAFANAPGPGPFALRAPQGSTLTQYANSLVDGAKSYNAHAVRYDPLGQQSDRFNSNSFVSSLIAAKGGANGLSDIRNIAAKVDAGPVTLSGQAPSLGDQAISNRAAADAQAGRPVAPGFGKARI